MAKMTLKEIGAGVRYCTAYCVVTWKEQLTLPIVDAVMMLIVAVSVVPCGNTAGEPDVVVVPPVHVTTTSVSLLAVGWLLLRYSCAGEFVGRLDGSAPKLNVPHG